MSKRFSKAILFALIFSTSVFAQISRTEGMGGLTYSIIDKDQSLEPYDFAKNPAWLYMDQQETYLMVTPSMSNNWGNYRRKYDAEGTVNYGASFTGVKTLGGLGTFLGYTSYKYENRRNTYRSLKKDSYAGEAFYFTDTTSQDFSYSGPEVQLMYSWEPVPRFYVGGSVLYEVLKGLKEKYSYAETIYRNTGITIGAAYNPFDNFIVAADIKYSDSQEAIKAEDVSLIEVETRLYRGDKYFWQKRSSSVTHKVKKSGITFGSQIYWDYNEELFLALQFRFTPSHTKIFTPYSIVSSTSSSSYDEFEEGYSAFENTGLQFKGQYKVTDDLLVGVYGDYNNNNNWSKISYKNLLIWEWDIDRITGGIGSTYSISPQLLFGFEYEYSHASADSSKYIDQKILSLATDDHSVKAGLEYEFIQNTFLRVGFNYIKQEHDLVYGGDDCDTYKITGSVGFPVADVLTIDANLQYINSLPGRTSGNADLKKTFLMGSITVVLKTF